VDDRLLFRGKEQGASFRPPSEDGHDGAAEPLHGAAVTLEYHEGVPERGQQGSGGLAVEALTQRRRTRNVPEEGIITVLPTLTDECRSHPSRCAVRRQGNPRGPDTLPAASHPL
jgi:hypothetical protein